MINNDNVSTKRRYLRMELPRELYIELFEHLPLTDQLSLCNISRIDLPVEFVLIMQKCITSLKEIKARYASCQLCGDVQNTKKCQLCKLRCDKKCIERCKRCFQKSCKKCMHHKCEYCINEECRSCMCGHYCAGCDVLIYKCRDHKNISRMCNICLE